MKTLGKKLYRFTPGPGDEGMRLDQFVAAATEELSRTFFRKVVDIGGVHVGGRRVRRCSHPVRSGEQVEIYLDGLSLEGFSLGPEHILFQDRYCLVIDKPAGVETQPTPARYKGTIYDALLRYLQNSQRPKDRPSLGMVQRLDRETSGAMIFSIHPRSHRPLTEAFAGRGVKKLYLALVEGGLAEPSGEIRSLLARNRASNLVRTVERGGKEAITRYRVLENFGVASLVEIELLTGRSHQIRAHFSEMGHPLLGDLRYGGPGQVCTEAIPRQMLHAWQLSLPHPVNSEMLDFEAPVPGDMEHLLTLLRQNRA